MLKSAKVVLGDVARSADPAAEKSAARNAQTVTELCDLYLADADAGRLVTRRGTQEEESDRYWPSIGASSPVTSNPYLAH